MNGGMTSLDVEYYHQAREMEAEQEKQRQRNEQILTAEPAKQHSLILEDIAYAMASEEIVLAGGTPTPDAVTTRAIEGLMSGPAFRAKAEMYTHYVAGLLRAGAPWQVHCARDLDIDDGC